MSQPQLLKLELSRSDAQPWGFRLQGGVDFASPLLIQKVNSGSLAEKSGLLPGDAVIKINDMNVFNLRHKDAQDFVVRSGNNFIITVQRGGSTWRPHITPTGHIPKHNQSPILHTVTKTSLAHKQQDSQHIGCGYNNSARPFANGGDNSLKSIMNKQYNTPVGIYSDESIAETLSAQAEVLAGGVLGVNFKKNEKEYQAERSEVLKFLREEESGQSTPASNIHQLHPESQQHHCQQQQSSTMHVSAPVNTPKQPSTCGLPTGKNICHDCERLITGVFVRIKDKNLHVECFKCATCGTSLKNQGYYNYNNKFYCDIHAKLLTHKTQPSGTEGYVPVPKNPNNTLSGTTICTILNAHGYDNGVANGSSSAPTAVPVNQGYLRPFGSSQTAPSADVPNSSISYPPPSRNTGQEGPGSKSGAFGATSTPKRGRGIYNKAVAPGVRVPLCNSCNKQIRGPFITALGRIWCPDHFTCVNGNCRHPLQDIGFVEEKGDLYCEYCFEKFLAPACSKCGAKIKGDCLNAIGKHFHPECFTCGHCGKMFGNAPFFLEDGNAYCEADWNELFTTKCFACGFPVEAGDRWVEALNHNYHSQCFNCTYCKQNLEGQIFYNKGGRPFCKNHAR